MNGQRIIYSYDDYPDTETGWRFRILDHGPVVIGGKRIEKLDPDELLSVADVADELTFLRRPAGPRYRDDTVRGYRQQGYLPVADVQKGGHWPAPGELIPVNGQYQHTGGHRLTKRREPLPGEKIRCDSYEWRRWRIWQWNAHRRGPGVAYRPGRVSSGPVPHALRGVGPGAYWITEEGKTAL